MAELTTVPAFRRIAAALAGATLLVALVVFVGGWMFGVVALRSVVPGTVGMKPLTAVGLAFAAGSLLLALGGRSPVRRVAGQVLAAGVALIGAAVLFEYVAGVGLGIDELLFVDGPGRAMGIEHPGRLAPSTAVCLILVGAALAAIDARGARGWRPAEVLVLPVGLLASLAIVGYLYEIPIFYGLASAAKMALNTALCFLALVFAVLLARPRGRLVELATTDDPGGMMLRRLVPVAVVVPMLLGWASLQADGAGVISHRVGSWIVSAVTIGALVVLISRVAARLSRDSVQRLAAQQSLAVSEELHRLTMANLPGAVVALYDRDLRCMLLEGQGTSDDLNTQTCRGNRIAEFAGEQVAADLEPLMRSALEGVQTQLEYVSPRTGGISQFEIAPFRGPGGSIDGALIVSADVTEQRRAQEAQRESMELFEAAFSRAPIGIGIVEPGGRYMQVNAALCAITGYTSQQLLAQAPFSFVHVDDLADVQARFGSLGVEGDTTAMEHRIVHADGHTVWVDARVTLVRTADGTPRHALAQILDITERRGYEHRLRHLADHDALTGLLNRRGFEHQIDAQIAHVRRYGTVGVLLMLDLDGFKAVNDTLGHATGDELIIAIGVALQHRLRETDIVARLGGDEFAVILPGETHEQALHVAAELLELVRDQAATLDGRHPGRVTVSIGVADFAPGVTAAEMLIRGDLAMYDAKESGKNQFASYNPDAHTAPRVQAQMTWVDRITDAIDRDRLVLYAQPIIDLNTREVAFHEILVRMLDEHGDLIPPATFLYIAERFGLDAWILQHALDAMASERAAGRRLPLSVNLSGASAGDPLITDLLTRNLSADHARASDLILELTETAAVADIPRARGFAEHIHDLGVRLALDDFGAGFGSFYYVKHLPFDILKLDGEFVRNAVQNHTDRQIITAVTGLAQGLGKQIVAEFVPDDATITLLLAAGADLGQGYHLGKPEPLSDILTAAAHPAR